MGARTSEQIQADKVPSLVGALLHLSSTEASRQ